MLLRMTPKLGARYWISILIASMFGTNLGDLLLETFGLSALTSVFVILLAFGAVATVDRQTSRGSEASYWICLLLVRAAATIVADFSVARERLGYTAVSVALGALLTVLLLRRRRGEPTSPTRDLPSTNLLYWGTMLVAGSLGTVVGDGMGHAFAKVQIGVPVSALIASAALAILLGLRHRLAWAPETTYWIAVVGVRWWGTNTGDITKFLLSIWVSMAITGSLLALVLLVWRARPNVNEDEASGKGVALGASG